MRLRVLLPASVAVAAAVTVVVALGRPRPPPDPEPVPADYAGVEAPVEAGVPPARVAEIFEVSCATCHGARGEGDGPAAQGLDPAPAAFGSPGFLEGRSDRYLYWRISEGKSLTPMPAFKYSLSPEERWALVRHLRDEWQTSAR